jgi:hypothetical protein
LPPALGVREEDMERRPRLFDALRSLLDLRFVADGGAEDIRGVVVFGDEAARRDLPVLRLAADDAPALGEASVRFADDPAVDGALRGWTNRDHHLAALSEVPSGAGWRPLAFAGETPVWAVSRSSPPSFSVAAPLSELAVKEVLRDRIVPGRCLALIALVTFVRRLFPEHVWTTPASGACFVIDDPNLRRLTYGFVDYRSLAASAMEHRYHVSVAHIPLDLRLVSRRAVALFAQNRSTLSLSVHGNTHHGPELGRLETDTAAAATLAAASRRVTRFERSHGLPIDRIMVPPHEATTEAVIRCLPAWGFEALITTRPHAFLYPLGTASAFAAPGSDAAGFAPADLVRPAVPVLTRRAYSDLEEIPLRGFLGQPIVFYGHADEFRHGLGVLEEPAASINRLPGVRWRSLQDIARACYETTVHGETLRVRPFARTLDIDVPAGVTSVLVEPLPGTAGGLQQMEVGDAAPTIVRWSVAPPMRTNLPDGRRLPPLEAVGRRLLTEGRDRLRPLVARRFGP